MALFDTSRTRYCAERAPGGIQGQGTSAKLPHPYHETKTMNSTNTADLHAAMRAQVDQQFLPCVSIAILRGQKVMDTFCYGHADKEAGIALREDHIFRSFSNTKLVTSCAALLLWEEGRFQLDDPIEKYIPELGKRQVLRQGASRIDDTEAARSSILLAP